MAKKVQWYRQCSYRKKTGKTSYKTGTSYLPEKLAVVGSPIYFGKKCDRPDPADMWIITEVSDRRRDGEYVTFKRNADQQQRKSSDV